MVGKQRGAGLGPVLDQRLHGEAAVVVKQEVERAATVSVAQLLEDVSEVGGTLLLEQVEQVGGRTNPLQSLDRVEHHVDSAVGWHGPVGRVESRRCATRQVRLDVPQSVPRTPQFNTLLDSLCTTMKPTTAPRAPAGRLSGRYPRTLGATPAWSRIRSLSRQSALTLTCRSRKTRVPKNRSRSCLASVPIWRTMAPPWPMTIGFCEARSTRDRAIQPQDPVVGVLIELVYDDRRPERQLGVCVPQHLFPDRFRREHPLRLVGQEVVRIERLALGQLSDDLVFQNRHPVTGQGRDRHNGGELALPAIPVHEREQPRLGDPVDLVEHPG